MLLAIDIGNTNIVIGVFQGKILSQHWKIQAGREKTCDEYAVTLLHMFALSGVAVEEIRDVIISSVVPPLTPVFQELSRKRFNIKPMVVGPGLKTGMSILYENPLEVGADRIVPLRCDCLVKSQIDNCTEVVFHQISFPCIVSTPEVPYTAAYNLANLNLRELLITDTELKLIAAAAMTGLRSIPTKG